MEEISFHRGKYEIKNYENVQWLKIFHHDCTKREFFQRGSPELLNINTKNRYSLLYIINEKFKIDGKYEFLLEYPEANKHNHWRQSNNPLNETDKYGDGVRSHYNASGYEDVNIQMRQHNWGGLVRGNSDDSLLEGSLGSVEWFYAIGQANSNWYSSSLAGFKYPNNMDNIHVVYLWIGVKDLAFIFYCDCTKISLILNMKWFISLISIFSCE